jgi:hypothetical protein
LHCIGTNAACLPCKSLKRMHTMHVAEIRLHARGVIHSPLDTVKAQACCSLRFSDLQFEDVNGNQLREVFPVRSRQLRPAPPEGCQQKSLDDYEVRRQRPAAGVACQRGYELLHPGIPQRSLENC